jgi:AcrR family transcriptional regulator
MLATVPEFDSRDSTSKAVDTDAPPARRGLVENEIYEHAARLFAQRGFAGTSLQDIATSLGITRPALYYYFKSKDEILAKLVKEITETAAVELTAIADARDVPPSERLRRLVRESTSRIAAHPERFQLLLKSESELSDEAAQHHVAGKQATLAAFALVMTDGIGTGEFRAIEAQTAALGIIGLCNWVAWWYQPGTDAGAMVDTLADMALSAVAAPIDRVPTENGPTGALDRLREDLDYLELVLKAANNPTSMPEGRK